MFVRTALGIVGASALAAGSMAPAVAHGDHESDKVKVVVCKKVKDDDNHHNHKWSKDDDEFDVDLWTDKDSDDTTLEDRECDRFKLEFKRNKLFLEEDVDEDEWDVDFKVFGDDEKVRERGNKLRVRFDDDEDHPKLVIVIVNEKKDDDDHHWKKHWDD